jgi:hypothetical protein
VEHAAPDAAAEHRDPLAGIARVGQPPDRRTGAEQRKQRRLRLDGRDALDFDAGHQRAPSLRSRPWPRTHRGAQILKVGVAELLAATLRLLPQRGKAPGVRIRQRTEQDAVGDAERGARGADADGEEHDRQPGDEPPAAKLPPRVADVEPDPFERAEAVHAVDLLANPRRVAERAARGGPRFVRAHPARDVLVGLDGEVRLELARALVVPAAAVEEPFQRHGLRRSRLRPYSSRRASVGSRRDARTAGT